MWRVLLTRTTPRYWRRRAVYAALPFPFDVMADKGPPRGRSRRTRRGSKTRGTGATKTAGSIQFRVRVEPMVRKVEIKADDKKDGMDADELRAAIVNIPPGVVPKVFTNWRGKVIRVMWVEDA
jgi:hypothetical protein